MQSQQGTFQNSYGSGNIVCFNHHQHISLQCDALKNVKPCLFRTSVYYGIIQKAFSHGWLPKCAICQVATFQMCNFPSGNFPKLRLDLHRLHWTGGQSAAARIGLGSCRLGNCTFRSLPLGKIPLGSCLWEST